VTVRQLLSHQAGLSALDKSLDLATIADHDALADVISRQKPAWEPGTRHGYHGISLGWYEGELIRRVDPKRRSIAKAYGAFAKGARELGITRETLDPLMIPAAPPTSGIRDTFRFGTSEKAFGTPGLGISFGYADPDTRTGFAYAPNKLGFYMWNDPREKALRDALILCLDRR
jgi:CubicO group peptidase (beta-lactamase class C family)